MEAAILVGVAACIVASGIATMIPRYEPVEQD